MAELTTNEKLNLAFKMVFSIQGTTNTDDASSRRWFEEIYPWAPILIAEDMYIDTVPWAAVGEGPAKQAANPTIIAAIDQRLTKKTGYNNRLWACHQTYNDENSDLLGDFLLPQKFGPGWTTRLYQDDGVGGKGAEITTTEGAWVFSYKAGFLLLGDGHTAANEGWTEPIHVVGYRYIGDTVADLSALAGLETIDYFAPTIQTFEFTLSGIPASPTKTDARVNGLPMYYGANRDFEVNGNTLTFHPQNYGYHIELGDVIQIRWK